MTKKEIISYTKEIITALINNSQYMREEYSDMNCAVEDAKTFIYKLNKEG